LLVQVFASKVEKNLMQGRRLLDHLSKRHTIWWDLSFDEAKQLLENLKTMTNKQQRKSTFQALALG